jgi:hypothetical protein
VASLLFDIAAFIMLISLVLAMARCAKVVVTQAESALEVTTCSGTVLSFVTLSCRR